MNCIFLQGWPRFELQNNHFLRANHQAWYVRVPTPFTHVGGVDLSWNWWGTDDPAEIAAWIYDEQDDPAAHVRVNFEPFLGGPVAAEEMTWGGVKSVYRSAQQPRTIAVTSGRTGHASRECATPAGRIQQPS